MHYLLPLVLTFSMISVDLQKSNGDLVRNPRDVKVGELVQLRLAKGEIGAQITGEVPTKAVIQKQKEKGK